MLNSICETLLQLAILMPLAIVGKRNNKNFNIRFLLIAILVFVVTAASSDLGTSITFFEGQRWNWAGKLISLLLALAFVLTFKEIPAKQIGLTSRMQFTNARPILIICTVYFVFRLALYLSVAKDIAGIHAETLFFQATLPGIEEEIIFRGILLYLLNQVFTRPMWTWFKVQFGWAAILTSLLFGLVHALHFDINFQIQFNLFIFFRTALEGFLLALLVERTKSLVAPIVYHNLLNLIGNH